MPIQYYIEGSTLYFIAEGNYGLADVSAALDRAILEPTFTAPMLLFTDARRSEANPSIEEIRRTAYYLDRIKGNFLTDWILVVSSPLHFGLARMLSMMIDFHGIDIHVYRDITEAKKAVQNFVA